MWYPWNYIQTKTHSLKVNCFRRFASYWEFIRPALPLLDPRVTGKVKGTLEPSLK